jgi:hypothetical protein
MGRRHAAYALAGVLLVTACGSSGPPKAIQSPTSSVSPTPTPTLPPVATDKTTAKAALVTAADLGKPWVVPKTVNKQKGAKGESCPGVKEEVAVVHPRAGAKVSMTEGTKTGAAIAAFKVYAFDPAQATAWRAAVDDVTRKCKAYQAKDNTYVTTEVMPSPPAVDGADEVVGRIERIYADAKHKTLYYVRHTVQARFGRIVVYTQHAFVQPKSDPTGKDVSGVAALVAKQAAKARSTFGL